MEMHQVRYFLAVARTLNFTRAAEECNVAQPSLTRAILEGGCSSIAHNGLRTERLVVRTYCEIRDELPDVLRAREFDVTRFHEVSADLPARSGARRGARTAQHAKPRYPYAHHGEWRRGQAHRASLWCGRKAAHGGRLGHDENAARLRLV